MSIPAGTSRPGNRLYPTKNEEPVLAGSVLTPNALRTIFDNDVVR